jgi:hypothetical protein
MMKPCLQDPCEASAHKQNCPQRRVGRYTGYRPYSRTASYMASKFSMGVPA